MTFLYNPIKIPKTKFMRKISFAIILMLLCSAAFAQFTVTGNVSDVNSQPVANKTVYAFTDSIPPNNPGLWGSGVTDVSGNYTITFATSPTVGTVVNIYTYDCTQAVVSDTQTFLGNNLINDFTICATVVPPSSIEGTITAANPVSGEPDAEVYLIQMSIDSLTNDTLLTAIDSTVTDTMGHYSFAMPNFWASELMVKAALLPANANYSGYLPTYYTASLVWSGASYLPNPLPVAGVNIQLIAGVNPGGPGFIGGNVAQGANKSTAVGDPLNHRILILTNMSGQAIAYTYSNASGAFSFSNLPLGIYKLFGDVMGKSNPKLQVTLDATHQSVTNIQFQEHSHLFEGHYITAASVGNIPVALQNASVFPNPATDKVSIVGINNVSGAKTITLTSMTGSVVYTHNFNENETVTVPVASLSKGIYMLQLNTTEGNVMFKVTK